MPELPEVETICRVMRGALVGKTIEKVEVVQDSIVFKGAPEKILKELLTGATVNAIGRRGKYWWLELDREPWMFGHLGMAGWVRDVTPDKENKLETRLREHGKVSWDTPEGVPKFLKLLMTTNNGESIALTDGRRLARVWLAKNAEEGVLGLGPDMRDKPWKPADLKAKLANRKAPIKALLLDQKLFAGVGNWIADEVLFQAAIAPTREGGSLSQAEIEKMLAKLATILELAIEVNADSSKYPEDWLFNSRWGGKRGESEIFGKTIVREAVGGRTTAWVPDLQR